MFEIETKDLKISDELNRKIDMICRFACVKYEFIPGNIKSIKNTNIAYAKLHILKVKENDYLILEESEEVFINGYNEKIKLKDSYNKQHKKITEINKNVDKINDKSNEVKEILENLKQQPLSKNNLIISSDKKDLDDNYKTIRNLVNDNEDLKIKLEGKESLLIVAKNIIKDLNKKVIVFEAKVESWKRRVNEIVDFISERVKGFFGNILKSKYKDVANDLRENNIITEKEYKKIYDLPIIKDYKEDKKKNNDLEL